MRPKNTAAVCAKLLADSWIGGNPALRAALFPHGAARFSQLRCGSVLLTQRR
jgi:hypothetical protein